MPVKSRKPIRALSQVLLLAIVLAGGGGCSSFHREWKAAVKQAVPTGGITGPWEGIWRSSANGHQGRLRCLVKPAEVGDYTARFHAVYRGFLQFGYSLPLRVESVPGGVRFQGEADLGWLYGGVYACQGQAVGDSFESTYTSRYDHGVFEMRRPVPRER